MNTFFPWSRYHARMAGPISLILFMLSLLLLGEGFYVRNNHENF